MKDTTKKSALLLASRMLQLTADEFDNHGCNDMDMSLFEGMPFADRLELEVAYNEWNSHSAPGTEDFCKLAHIGDSAWMAFLAHTLSVETK